MEDHPLFVKYTRQWLHKVTGFSKGYLSRVATGKAPLSPSFIERACYKLNQPEADLFLPDGAETCCQGPYGCAASKIGRWLEDRCNQENLTLRQAAEKTSLSHACIANIRKGDHPSPETVHKLAKAFGGDGYQGLVLEDELLIIAGYRRERPEEAPLSEVEAQLRDREKLLNNLQLTQMVRFADFLIEVTRGAGASQGLRVTH